MPDTGSGLQLAAEERGHSRCTELFRTVNLDVSTVITALERETQQSSTLKAQADAAAFSLLFHLSHLCPRYDPAPKNNCDASIVKACSQ